MRPIRHGGGCGRGRAARHLVRRAQARGAGARAQAGAHGALRRLGAARDLVQRLVRLLRAPRALGAWLPSARGQRCAALAGTTPHAGKKRFCAGWPACARHPPARSTWHMGDHALHTDRARPRAARLQLLQQRGGLRVGALGPAAAAAGLRSCGRQLRARGRQLALQPRLLCGRGLGRLVRSRGRGLRVRVRMPAARAPPQTEG
jgi:hypothetical protein